MAENGMHIVQEPAFASLLRWASAPVPPVRAIERRTLVVEDEWMIRLALGSALESAGWTVCETNSGEEVAVLLASGNQFDLVVTDIRLSGDLTGWDVAEACRARNPNACIIYASGNSIAPDRLVAGSLFIEKPVPMDDLVSACERMWQAVKNSS